MKIQTSGQLRSSVFLLLAAIFWGTAFVAQSIGNRYIAPFTFNACRFFLGSAVLVPVSLLMKRINQKEHPQLSDPATRKKNRKTLWIGGICCGFCMFGAGGLQQVGMLYTTVGKSGFITAMYIILVPIFGLFLKKKCSFLVWISVVLAIFGMYLLCMTEGFSVNKGDLITFGCAIMFACHILTVDHFAPKVDAVSLSCIQFLTAGLISIIPMLLFETPTLSAVRQAAGPILYLGIFSCGLAYTLQIAGQKGLNPTLASLIMSLESAISALAGWIILNEALSPRELCGCAVMFLAIILSQLPVPVRKAKYETR